MALLKSHVFDVQKNIYLNVLLRYARGTFVTPAINRTPIVTAASSTSAPLIIEGPQDAVTEIFDLSGLHGSSDLAAVTNRLQVYIDDIKWRRPLMNRPVLVNHVFGNQLQPYVLPETLLMEGQQVISFQFTNPSAAGASNFSFGAQGFKVQKDAISQQYANQMLQERWKRNALLYPFWLTLDRGTISLAASASGIFFFTNESDKVIALTSRMATALTTGVAGDTTELFSASYLYPGKNTSMSNAPITLNTGHGTARFPYYLPHPIIIMPNEQIQVQITNLVTDAATEIAITFGGVACYQGSLLTKASGIVKQGRFLSRDTSNRQVVTTENNWSNPL